MRLVYKKVYVGLFKNLKDIEKNIFNDKMVILSSKQFGAPDC